MEVSEPNKRAIKIAESILKSKGVEIIEFDLNDMFEEIFI